MEVKAKKQKRFESERPMRDWERMKFCGFYLIERGGVLYVKYSNLHNHFVKKAKESWKADRIFLCEHDKRGFHYTGECY